MSWSEQVFRYCERGSDPTFWAEPFNALSNVAFLVVAAVAARRLAAGRGPAARHGARPGAVAPEPGRALAWLLVALVAAIGIGSFLFHTFATRWARLADVAPIGVFMVAYLAFALKSFLGWGAGAVAGTIGAFLAANALLALVACPRQAIAVTAYARDPCLNGTMSYLPALATLALVGALLVRRHPAGRHLLAAAGILLAAMLLRWLDKRSCGWSMLLGGPRGTHALWHLAVAATLHVLLLAATRRVQ